MGSAASPGEKKEYRRQKKTKPLHRAHREIPCSIVTGTLAGHGVSRRMKSDCLEIADHQISIRCLLDGLDKPSVYWLGSRVRLYVLPNPELPETGVSSGRKRGPTVRRTVEFWAGAYTAGIFSMRPFFRLYFSIFDDCVWLRFCGDWNRLGRGERHGPIEDNVHLCKSGQHDIASVPCEHK